MWTGYPLVSTVKRTAYPTTNEVIPMQEKPVALVTGANKGIGLQIAKDLAGHGFAVVVGSRNLESGQIAAKSVGDDARAVQLDVTDQTSIAAAADRIRSELGRLDVLVNNAGISHADTPGRSLEEVVADGHLSVAPLDEVRTVFDTNVFGIIAVTQAMLPLLRESSAARIVNVASSGGSLTLNSDPTNHHRAMFGTYSASKAAANAVTVGFAAELESVGIKVNAACPGFTGTDLNFFRGTRTVARYPLSGIPPWVALIALPITIDSLRQP
jgi:NAD(P)-dependent dehydrogenase (short-subunit alcohol dehydrogenase family)